MIVVGKFVRAESRSYVMGPSDRRKRTKELVNSAGAARKQESHHLLPGSPSLWRRWHLPDTCPKGVGDLVPVRNPTVLTGSQLQSPEFLLWFFLLFSHGKSDSSSLLLQRSWRDWTHCVTQLSRALWGSVGNKQVWYLTGSHAPLPLLWFSCLHYQGPVPPNTPTS